MRVGVIGGGVAGLGCAYFLSAAGCDVDIFEQAPTLGGLAGSFDFDGVRVEKYYHFICRDDLPLIEMLQRLDLATQLEWRPGQMRFFHSGRMYSFGTPWDLLRFKPLPLWDRLRFGLNIARARSEKVWQRYEGMTAHDWLVGQIGTRAYTAIWEPLLRIKFGPYYDRISASWMWHRIHRIARSRAHLFAREELGFIRGGTDVLIEALARKLDEARVAVHLSSNVEGITMRDGAVTGLTVAGEHRAYDTIICTAPLPVLARLLPAGTEPYTAEFAHIEYISVVCLVLKLRHPVTDGFWINVNEPRAPFNGFIEYTNLNPRTDAGAPHLLYVPFYLPPGAARYAQPDDELLADCIEGLRVIQPAFDSDWILGTRVFRDRYAQAICTTHFARRIPSLRSPVGGLYVTDSTQLYPSDRTISGMFGLAQQVAGLVLSEK